MSKNVFTRVTAILTAILMAMVFNIGVYAVEEDNADAIDGAPVIYVLYDSDLPQAMLDNIRACEGKEYLAIAKEEAYNTFVDENAFDMQSAVSFSTIVRPWIHWIYQHPQERSYYCGYAAFQSILEYHGINMTQEEIADEAYDKNSALAWFTGINDYADNWQYYPAAVYLSSKLDHQYRPYNSYFGTYTANELSAKLKYDIVEANEPIMIAGVSKGNDSNGSRLPGYPTNANISHWIVGDGFKWDIDTQTMPEVHYVDPAKSDAITWSGSIEESTYKDLTRMYNFSTGHGIIW